MQSAPFSSSIPASVPAAVWYILTYLNMAVKSTSHAFTTFHLAFKLIAMR
ncbi:hypothetical protein V8F33_001022 [Rhypophila sp. PSN 637]